MVHPNGPLTRRAWGVDDFAALDLDGNLIGFYEPTGEG